MCDGITCLVLSSRVSPMRPNEFNNIKSISGYTMGYGNCTGCSPSQSGMLWFTGCFCPCCKQRLRRWPHKGLRKLEIKNEQKLITEEIREMKTMRMEVLSCAKNIEGLDEETFRKIYRMELKHQNKIRVIPKYNDARIKSLFKNVIQPNLPSGL